MNVPKIVKHAAAAGLMVPALSIIGIAATSPAAQADEVTGHAPTISSCPDVGQWCTSTADAGWMNLTTYDSDSACQSHGNTLYAWNAASQYTCEENSSGDSDLFIYPSSGEPPFG